jgi:endonuclease/exonuclease/phosphatase (EEP) superfamily protein YafD
MNIENIMATDTLKKRKFDKVVDNIEIIQPVKCKCQEDANIQNIITNLSNQTFELKTQLILLEKELQEFKELHQTHMHTHTQHQPPFLNTQHKSLENKVQLAPLKPQKTYAIRHSWSAEEDDALIKAYEKAGQINNWVNVKQYMLELLPDFKEEAYKLKTRVNTLRKRGKIQ